MSDIYCLMLTGSNLTAEARSALLRTAKDMVRNRLPAAAIKNDACEGIVETTGAHASMGTISGQQFKADLLMPAPFGEASVSFIVRTSDLEWLANDDTKGWWGPTDIPIDEWPKDMRPGRGTVH